MAEQWILDLSKELELPHPSPVQDCFPKCIYRVPKILTDVNGQAYEPKLASLGPYHHDRPHLRPMEPHKRRALLQFLRRASKRSSPEDLLISMRKAEPRLLASYDALDDALDEDDEDRPRRRRRQWLKEKDEFLKLMILDGCFALEVMLAEKRSALGQQSEYDSHDPVFGPDRKSYIVPDLKRDMLLLENQLPLLALSTLASLDGSGMGDVPDLIKSFYGFSSKGSEQSFVHILDMYRHLSSEEGEYLPSYEENVQSATELREAGIAFSRSGSKSYRDINFNAGELSLPALEIDDTTESLLLNLMAFERLHATAGNEVTAYVFFMDGLINTEDDVALLRTEEIIMGWVGCDGNIASMFNRITKEATLVVFKNDIQVDVNSRLNGYCKRRAHRWRASFVHTYLKNPWVFISLLGGFFLLALTIMQTVYSMLQYYHPKIY